MNFINRKYPKAAEVRALTTSFNLLKHLNSKFAKLRLGKRQDSTCVKSITGYMICVPECPVIWKSKLQTETALSPMNAEYVTLSKAITDLIIWCTRSGF